MSKLGQVLLHPCKDNISQLSGGRTGDETEREGASWLSAALSLKPSDTSSQTALPTQWRPRLTGPSAGWEMGCWVSDAAILDSVPFLWSFTLHAEAHERAYLVEQAVESSAKLYSSLQPLTRMVSQADFKQAAVISDYCHLVGVVRIPKITETKTLCKLWSGSRLLLSMVHLARHHKVKWVLSRTGTMPPS